MRYMLIHAADPELASDWDDEAQASCSSWIEKAIRSGVSLQGSRLRAGITANLVSEMEMLPARHALRISAST